MLLNVSRLKPNVRKVLDEKQVSVTIKHTCTYSQNFVRLRKLSQYHWSRIALHCIFLYFPVLYINFLYCGVIHFLFFFFFCFLFFFFVL